MTDVVAITEAKAVKPSAWRFDKFGALRLGNIAPVTKSKRVTVGGIMSKVDSSATLHLEMMRQYGNDSSIVHLHPQMR